MNPEGTVDPRLVEQRMRNRLIEYLEDASSFEAQLEHQRNVPIAHVSHEMIEGWFDSYKPEYPGWYGPPAYSPDEVEAMARFQRVIDWVCDVTPSSLPSIEEMIRTEPWARLRDAAVEALAVFRVRGKRSDDVLDL